MKIVQIKTIESPVIIAFLIFLAAFLAHATSLNGGFKAIDDKISIVANPDLDSFSSIPKIFSEPFFGVGGFYRPLVAVSFLLEKKLFGLNPFYFLLTNLILHAFNAVFVYLIVSSLTKERRVGFLTGLVFAVHPIHWEAVSNISGRAVLLCAFWSFLSFIFYLISTRRNYSWVLHGVSLLFFSLALFSKEEAVMLPFIIVCFELFYMMKEDNKIERGLSALSFFAVSAIYMVLRQGLDITVNWFWPKPEMVILGFLTFLRGFLIYLRLIIFPSGFYFDRAIPFFNSFFNLEILLTLFCASAAITAVYIYRGKLRRSVCLFLAWGTLGFLPVSQLIPLSAYPDHAALADHFAYIPSVGLFFVFIYFILFLFGLSCERKLLSPGSANFILVVYLVFLALMTAALDRCSANELSMLRESLAKDPNNTRVRGSYGLALIDAKQYASAEQEFRKVLKTEPNDPRMGINLAKTLIDQGKLLEGIEVYEKISSPGKLAPLLKENLEKAYILVLERYKAKLIDNLDDPRIYYSMGVMFSKQGEVKKAIAEFEKALTLNPHYKNALFNLGSCYYYLGERDLSLKYYEQMVSYKFEKDDYDLLAYRRLEEFFRDLKDYKKVEFYSRKAEELATILGK
ncbi:MAG: tetratricopeptide repeat protein [Candidatus Omnitrophica bacterium]|nr:tetratricopeptide repeat protein [Candidatus Omnitrophota bacterium]